MKTKCQDQINYFQIIPSFSQLIEMRHIDDKLTVSLSKHTSHSEEISH